MADYSAYFNRLNAQGVSHQEAMKNTTKRLAEQNIMNSPSRVDVDVLKLERNEQDETFEIVHDETQVAIVSNKQSFYRREVLVLPDVELKMGMYLTYEDMYYLVTESNIDVIYLNSLMLLCNNMLELVGKTERVRNGADDFGRPIWKETQKTYKIPCSIESKEYSIAERSPIPLPDGVINISIPYHKDIKVPINYLAQFNGESYQVTSVNYEKVINKIGGEKYGYVVLRGQRVVD